MSERKVLNKYFPPNFDPSQIPRQKRPKDLQHKVRLMAPFSMRCNSCGEYIYKGKKFNARKETVENETYLSIKIFRFYIRCPRCSAEITFKTDPKNTDYVAEHGASRNFEPWRTQDGVEDDREEEEDVNDPMKALENRTIDSKREMDILDALDEIRLRNARSERLKVDQILRRFSDKDKEEIEERLKQEAAKDEEEAIKAFQSADGERVRKLADDEKEPDVLSLVSKSFKKPSFKPAEIPKRKVQEELGVAVKRKKDNNDTPASALSMLSNYDDSEDSESSE